MKTPLVLRWGLVAGLALWVLLLVKPGSAWADDPQPVITSIRLEGTNVVVAVRVPSGLKKVMLEGRARLGKGAWVPRAVQRMANGQGGELEFKLPRSADVETLRIRADRAEVLPPEAYAGAGDFAAVPESPSAPGRGELFGPADGAGGSLDPNARAVVESDIWKRQGDTLYFFNQFRGLQVIDVSRPDEPVLRGQLALPASGDQMYLLGSAHVLLLARDDCSYGPAGPESEVVLVEVSDPAAPKVAARLGLGGYVAESRLVGTALYVASQNYRPKTNDLGQVEWEWGTSVTSFDFADPAAPARGDTLWFAGWGHVIQATDRFLFLAHNLPEGGWSMEVEVVDISDPRGAMRHESKVRVAGNVADKFKMHLSGEVLTVISFGWVDDRRWVTTLQTFSLATPSAPQALGRLQLAEGEQLHATRFDGDRVYIVTFLRIDPLWVVDLSDPVRPRVAGELEVPGWSTYIHPLGDRLVAIGVDPTNGWRVAVSLFDVSDPARPGLLDKELLGENYSWSEANYDEKAFSVLADDGLIMLPYQGYLTNGYANRIQLLDLGPATLTLRGQIEHSLTPRRATLHRDRIYSISGTELLAVDATDRDHPVVKATVELSWSVDRVMLAGAYVLEVTDGAAGYGGWWRGWSSDAQPPAVRVALAARTEQVLGQWRPERDWPILGTARRGDRLFVLQGWRPDLWAEPVPVENKTNVVLTTLDLSHLPALPVVAEAGIEAGALSWGSAFEPLWPGSDLLVWSEVTNYSFWWDYGWFGGGRPVGVFVDGAGGPRVAPPPYWYPWGGGSSTGRLLAYEVGATRWGTEVASMGGTNAWSYSACHAAAGLVLASHTSYEVVTNIVDGQPYERWMARQWLDVVDYADPSTPTLRPTIPFPGRLVGLGYGGEVLYAESQRTWDPEPGVEGDWLAAVSYDGVEAHVADATPLPWTWPRPLLTLDGVVYLVRVGTNYVSADLESWRFSAATAKLERLSVQGVGPSTYSLVAVGPYLGASDGRAIGLFDTSDPTSPALWLKGEFDGCSGGSLEHADATSAEGLVAPLGNYGVARMPAPGGGG